MLPSRSPLEVQRREDALAALGTAVGSIPFDARAMKDARDMVEKVGGMELVVESCMTAAAFEAITKVVDATGRTLPSKLSNRISFMIIRCVQLRWTVAAGMVVVVAAAMASSVVRS